MKHLQLGIAWAVGEKWLILKRETPEVAALDIDWNGKWIAKPWSKHLVALEVDMMLALFFLKWEWKNL